MAACKPARKRHATHDGGDQQTVSFDFTQGYVSLLPWLFLGSAAVSFYLDAAMTRADGLTRETRFARGLGWFNAAVGVGLFLLGFGYRWFLS